MNFQIHIWVHCKLIDDRQKRILQSAEYQPMPSPAERTNRTAPLNTVHAFATHATFNVRHGVPRLTYCVTHLPHARGRSALLRDELPVILWRGVHHQVDRTLRELSNTSSWKKYWKLQSAAQLRFAPSYTRPYPASQHTRKTEAPRFPGLSPYCRQSCSSPSKLILCPVKVGDGQSSRRCY